MFEDSTFESNGKIRTRSRRWMLVTFALNASVLLALILIPLIYPEAIPRFSTIALIEAPVPPPEAPRPVHVPPNAVAVQPTFDPRIFTAPRTIPQHINYDPILEPSRPIGIGDTNIATNSSLDNIFTDHPVQVVQEKPKRPTTVMSTIMQGLLVHQVVPSYPAIPKASHMEGTVVLAATISKTGEIVNLHVVSGSPMFTPAAMDAVAQWRYRPYLLNGQPVEVETTVNIVFRLE